MLIELNPSLNYYKLSGLTLGATLKVEVSTLNEIGESDKSKSVSLIFANVPSAPQTLTLQTSESVTILAAWTMPSNVNGDAVRGYRVYVDDGMGGSYSMVFDGLNYPSTYMYELQGL
jgi:hypothetical protein